MAAGMATGFGLEGIDKHFNISGYHRVNNVAFEGLKSEHDVAKVADWKKKDGSTGGLKMMVLLKLLLKLHYNPGRRLIDMEKNLGNLYLLKERHIKLVH